MVNGCGRSNKPLCKNTNLAAHWNLWIFPSRSDKPLQTMGHESIRTYSEILKQATPSSLEIRNYKNQIDSSFNLINDEYFNEVVNISKVPLGLNKNSKTSTQLPCCRTPLQSNNMKSQAPIRKSWRIHKNPSLFFSDSKFIPDFLKKKHPFTTL